MPIISVTRLHLRSVRFLPAFSWYTFATIRQAKQTAGNLGIKLRKTNGLAFWTLTQWQSVEAMKKFMFASPHKEAMLKLPYWCDEGSFADWHQDSSEWPPWDEAAQKLRASGQLTKVLHPSERHKEGEIETP
jgi:uncharacterized protein DUF3291